MTWYHVFPRYELKSNEYNWLVMKEGADRASTVESMKSEAVSAARRYADNDDGIVVYKLSGKSDVLVNGRGAPGLKPGYPIGTFKWDIRGAAVPDVWRDMISNFEADRIGNLTLDLQPKGPNWGEPDVGFARSAKKPRGNHVYAEIGMATQSMVKLQGTIGSRDPHFTGSWARYMNDASPENVRESANLFEKGERPGPFVIKLDKDGSIDHWQEGRHRILGAEKAGIDLVPALILREARIPRLRGEEGEDYFRRYP